MNEPKFLYGQSTAFAFVSGFLMTLNVTPSLAQGFDSSPVYDETVKYNTAIPTTGSNTGFDETKIYFPLSDDPNDTFPLVLMLQGALIDKQDYDNFADLVARYGFAVVVPNHERTLFGPTGSLTGLFPDQELVNDVLDFMVDENVNTASPLEGKVDTTKMGLLGHSFGGAAGLSSIDNFCFPGLCNGSFEKPEELKAGIFYGTNYIDPITGNFLSIDNMGIPTGLIAGELDGVVELFEVEETYRQIQSPPKVLVTVLGSNHYGITNEDNVLRDPNRPTLAQAVTTETIARWSGLFMRAHIEDDFGAFDYIYNSGDLLDENVIVTSVPVPEPSLVWSNVIIAILIGRLTKKAK